MPVPANISGFPAFNITVNNTSPIWVNYWLLVCMTSELITFTRYSVLRITRSRTVAKEWSFLSTLSRMVPTIGQLFKLQLSVSMGRWSLRLRQWCLHPPLRRVLVRPRGVPAEVCCPDTKLSVLASPLLRSPLVLSCCEVDAPSSISLITTGHSFSHLFL